MGRPANLIAGRGRGQPGEVPAKKARGNRGHDVLQSGSGATTLPAGLDRERPRFSVLRRRRARALRRFPRSPRFFRADKMKDHDVSVLLPVRKPQLLGRTPAALDALLRPLPAGLLTVDEGPGTWSPMQVGGAPRLGRGRRLDATRAPRAGRTGEAFTPFDREAGFARYAGWSVDRLLDEFRGLRAASLLELDAWRSDPLTYAGGPASGVWPRHTGTTARDVGDARLGAPLANCARRDPALRPVGRAVARVLQPVCGA